jgi:hypothetical protein
MSEYKKLTYKQLKVIERHIEVHDRYFVNPEIGELNGSIIFLIESKKVPDEEATDQDYWNAYREVAEKVRARLGNPRMNLTEESINITYFEKI